MPLVSRVVHPRDHLGHAVALPRELADDDVVLVVSRHRHDDVGRTRDAGLLQHVQLGAVAIEGFVPELVLERCRIDARLAR